MLTEGEIGVARFSVEVELANNDDLVAVRRGILGPDKVHRLNADGWVDSGATRMVLPESVAHKLGLSPTGKVHVTYANGRSAIRDTVQGVYVEIMGRHGVFSASLEPRRKTVLIGAIVLEELDFLIDPRNERLYPRDPKMILTEAE
jgi:predicted aspartyl protease